MLNYNTFGVTSHGLHPRLVKRENKMSNSVSLRASFHQYFAVVPAETEELLHETFKIRYQVYCEELGYEDKNSFRDQEEVDGFDPVSQHCLLLHKSSNIYAGSIRLVSAVKNRLPFESLYGVHAFRSESIDFRQLDPLTYAEISRIAVISHFRRRKDEQNTPAGVIPEPESHETERRSFPLIAFGLYLSAAGMGLNSGLERVFAMMEPRLARRLRIYGINFQQIGPEIEHRGKRAPFQITRAQLSQGIAADISGLLSDISLALETKSNPGMRKSA